MADEPTASAEATGVGGPAPGGPPAEPSAPGTQAPAAGGKPEAPDAGTPDGWPEVPDAQPPTQEGAPSPKTPEIDYRQRFADTKADRDRQAQILKRLQSDRIIDDEGNLLIEIEEEAQPQPRAQPAQRATSGLPPDVETILSRTNSEAWDRALEEIEATHGRAYALAMASRLFGQQQQAPPPQPQGQQLTPQMVQQLAAQTVQPQLLQARQFGRKVNRELDALGRELPGFLDETRTIDGTTVTRAEWLEDACIKTGLTPKQALARFVPDAYIKAQVEARFAAERVTRDLEGVGDGGPMVGMPGIPQPTDDELDQGDAYARKLGLRTEEQGPVKAPGFD